MSVFDNIILATDSYKVGHLVCTRIPQNVSRRRAGELSACGATISLVSQVSHYKQYPPGTNYVYSVCCRSLPLKMQRCSLCRCGGRRG